MQILFMDPAASSCKYHSALESNEVCLKALWKCASWLIPCSNCKILFFGFSLLLWSLLDKSLKCWYHVGNICFHMFNRFFLFVYSLLYDDTHCWRFFFSFQNAAAKGCAHQTAGIGNYIFSAWFWLGFIVFFLTRSWKTFQIRASMEFQPFEKDTSVARSTGRQAIADSSLNRPLKPSLSSEQLVFSAAPSQMLHKAPRF